MKETEIFRGTSGVFCLREGGGQNIPHFTMVAQTVKHLIWRGAGRYPLNVPRFSCDFGTM